MVMACGLTHSGAWEQLHDICPITDVTLQYGGKELSIPDGMVADAELQWYLSGDAMAGVGKTVIVNYNDGGKAHSIALHDADFRMRLDSQNLPEIIAQIKRSLAPRSG